MIMTIASLELSARSFNALERNNIHTLEDLVSLLVGDYKKFTRIRNLGLTSQNEILDKLKKVGIRTAFLMK